MTIRLFVVFTLMSAAAQGADFRAVECEGTYAHHLQGICVDDSSIYWSFTTTLVKTDLQGKVIKKIPVVNHHGDLCHKAGRIYVAVNLGKFNDPKGNADSWVYVYDQDLELLSKHETQQVFHGAGGMSVMGDHFFVVGGLPDGVQENYVYEYDQDLQFVKKHVIDSGHTLLGIQTAAFAHDRWWFGCYGQPAILLVTDKDFNMLGRHEYNCSLGIEEISGGKLLSATGKCTSGTGCTGRIFIAEPDAEKGLIVKP